MRSAKATPGCHPAHEDVSHTNWNICIGNMHVCDTSFGGASRCFGTGAGIAPSSWHWGRRSDVCALGQEEMIPPQAVTDSGRTQAPLRRGSLSVQLATNQRKGIDSGASAHNCRMPLHRGQRRRLDFPALRALSALWPMVAMLAGTACTHQPTAQRQSAVCSRTCCGQSDPR